MVINYVWKRQRPILWTDLKMQRRNYCRSIFKWTCIYVFTVSHMNHLKWYHSHAFLFCFCNQRFSIRRWKFVLFISSSVLCAWWQKTRINGLFKNRSQWTETEKRYTCTHSISHRCYGHGNKATPTGTVYGAIIDIHQLITTKYAFLTNWGINKIADLKQKRSRPHFRMQFLNKKL